MRSKLLYLALFLPGILPAQNQTSVGFNIEGQIVAATDGKGMYINAGGPGLKFIRPKVAFSVNMMPSLRFQHETGKPLVTPILGCGPQVYLLKNKRFVVSFPCYYNATSRVWTFNAGLGYVLTGIRGKKKEN
jgi:hypothetical protein